tara:strand:+ start:642 stop:812 length:171 start_codon:yes stop_codon:yes gene_type:complete
MKDMNEIVNKLWPQIEQTIWNGINWEINQIDMDGDEYNELSTKIYKAILTKLIKFK